MKKISLVSLLVMPLMLSGCLSKLVKHTDPKDYASCLESAINNSDFHSELYIFPKNVKEESISNFAYQTSDGLFNGYYFFYLVVNYNQADFEQELLRLDSVKATFKKENYLISPYSIEIALNMLRQGANKNTAIAVTVSLAIIVTIFAYMIQTGKLQINLDLKNGIKKVYK